MQFNKMSDPDDADSVTLVLAGKRITADKQKLATASLYFTAMFRRQNGFIENSKSDIELQGISPTVLQILVDYAESDEMTINIDSDSSLDLLNAACMLQFEGAVNEVEQYLLQNISAENCLEIVAVSESCALARLYNKAKAYSLWYSEDVFQSDSFLCTPVDIVKGYLSDRMLNVSTEFRIFEAIDRWIGCERDVRRKELESLFSCLVLDDLLPSDLDNFQANELVIKDRKCAEKLQMLQEDRTQQSSSSHPSRRVPKVLLAVGGEFLTEEKYMNTDILMLECGELVTLTSLPVPDQIWGQSACVSGKNLFISGGRATSGGMQTDWNYHIWCYDNFDKNWKQVTKIPRPRRHHSMLALDEFLYLIGGFGKHRIIQDTVDRYDILKDEWLSLPKLNSVMTSPATCFCSGDLYVIRHSIEVLQQGAANWIELQVPDFPFEIGLHSAIAVGTDIYLMGMHSSKLVKFDTVAKQVRTVGCFTGDVGYGNLHDEKIFALFGEQSKNIEAYDLETGAFSVVYTAEFSLWDHSAVLLPKYPDFRPVLAKTVAGSSKEIVEGFFDPHLTKISK